jgi:hypothetical protein
MPSEVLQNFTDNEVEALCRAVVDAAPKYQNGKISG